MEPPAAALLMMLCNQLKARSAHPLAHTHLGRAVTTHQDDVPSCRFAVSKVHLHGEKHEGSTASTMGELLAG